VFVTQALHSAAGVVAPMRMARQLTRCSSCAFLALWMSGISSRRRAKPAAWMKFLFLKACAMARFTASMRCGGSSAQCVIYAASSIWRVPSAGSVARAASMMRQAVLYSATTPVMAFTSATSALLCTTSSGMRAKRPSQRAADSGNLPSCTGEGDRRGRGKGGRGGESELNEEGEGQCAGSIQ